MAQQFPCDQTELLRLMATATYPSSSASSPEPTLDGPTSNSPTPQQQQQLAALLAMRHHAMMPYARPPPLGPCFLPQDYPVAGFYPSFPPPYGPGPFTSYHKAASAAANWPYCAGPSPHLNNLNLKLNPASFRPDEIERIRSRSRCGDEIKENQSDHSDDREDTSTSDDQCDDHSDGEDATKASVATSTSTTSTSTTGSISRKMSGSSRGPSPMDMSARSGSPIMLSASPVPMNTSDIHLLAEMANNYAKPMYHNKMVQPAPPTAYGAPTAAKPPRVAGGSKKKRQQDLEVDPEQHTEQQQQYTNDNNTQQQMASTTSTTAGATPKNGNKRRERWTPEEHELFLEGLKRFGRRWTKIQTLLTHKTASQIRVHAYSYFSKVMQDTAFSNGYGSHMLTSPTNGSSGGSPGRLSPAITNMDSSSSSSIEPPVHQQQQQPPAPAPLSRAPSGDGDILEVAHIISNLRGPRTTPPAVAQETADYSSGEVPMDEPAMVRKPLVRTPSSVLQPPRPSSSFVGHKRTCVEVGTQEGQAKRQNQFSMYHERQ